MGNHQTAGGVPAPRELHPSKDRLELPPLVATDHVVRAYFTCSFPPKGEKLTRSVALPLPTKSYDFVGALITLQRSTLWPDRSIVSPIACHRHAGGRPALRACRFSLRTGQGQA